MKNSPTKVLFALTFRTIEKKARTIWDDDNELEDGLVGSYLLKIVFCPLMSANGLL